MHNDDSKVKSSPKRGPGPMGHGPGAGEKPKNFKTAISRLFKELGSFRFLIIVALVLAALGSILSIISPNKLSELTDTISEGLVINSKNLETLTTELRDSLSEETLATKVPEILDLNVTNSKIASIMSSEEITTEEKEQFQTIITSNTPDMTMLASLSDELLNLLLEDSVIEGREVSIQDKITFLRALANINNEEATTEFVLSEELSSILLPEITIDNITISASDQAVFISKMSKIDPTKTTSIYSVLDEMPESIRKLVEPVMDMDTIKGIALFLVTIYLLSALFTYIESISMTNVSNKFAKKLRTKISVKINRLPLKYFDKHTTGDILSRVTNDVDTIAQSMNQSLSSLVSAATLFIGTVIMMFATNWIMALTAIFSSLIGFVLMFIILGKSQKYFIARQVELGNLNGHIEEVYSGLNVVKVYNGKEESDIKFDELNEKVYECNRKSQFLSGLMQPIMGFIGNFGYVAVCIVGALLTSKGITTFGVIVAFIMYVRLFTSPLSQIAQAMTALQTTAAASERVFEFADEEEMNDEKDFKKYLSKEEVKGEIEFNHVKFKYADAKKPTINDFTASIKPGQKVAIVGPTGAGKTTMVNLLMKFYEINEGDIKIDGVSTKELTRDNIHALFTMVLQDTWLFSGTVTENIAYNRPNVSPEQVKEVCKTVGLDHFVKTLPNGYNSVISDNDSVSAGQRQLLTIARGMIEDSPFLILDEATSNVDTRTEELVQQAMDKLTEGKTSFIIAHRLSTIRNADLILVMKDGDIIETGSHDELMKKQGFYADLYNSQFEL